MASPGGTLVEGWPSVRPLSAERRATLLDASPLLGQCRHGKWSLGVSVGRSFHRTHCSQGRWRYTPVLVLYCPSGGSRGARRADAGEVHEERDVIEKLTAERHQDRDTNGRRVLSGDTGAMWMFVAITLGFLCLVMSGPAVAAMVVRGCKRVHGPAVAIGRCARTMVRWLVGRCGGKGSRSYLRRGHVLLLAAMIVSCHEGRGSWSRFAPTCHNSTRRRSRGRTWRRRGGDRSKAAARAWQLQWWLHTSAR